jgi:hypothetical protein
VPSSAQAKRTFGVGSVWRPALGAADPQLRVVGVDLERDERHRRRARLPRLAVVRGDEDLGLLEQRADQLAAGRLDRVEVRPAELGHRFPRPPRVL